MCLQTVHATENVIPTKSTKVGPVSGSALTVDAEARRRIAGGGFM